MAASWLRLTVARWRWRAEQDRLASRVLEQDDFSWTLKPSSDGRPLLRLVGGLDISFFSDGGNPDDDRACVALIVCEFDEQRKKMNVVWKDFMFVRMTEPYIAGFLAFREAPHYCEMFRRLEEGSPHLMPEVVLVDGNGVLHPRACGVASHVGVVANKCTIGVAKNLHMVDGLQRDVIKERCGADPGSFVPLVGDSGRTWGGALLPQPKAPIGPKAAAAKAPPKNPIFVSVGHRISLETTVAVVEECLISARVPEPVRLADLLSREQVRLAREKEPAVPSKVAASSALSLLQPRAGLAFLIAGGLGVGGLLMLQRSRRRLSS